MRAVFLFASAAPLLAGCATYDRIKAPPAAPHALSIQYSSAGPSGWTDLPIGTYQVPDSDVIVSGHQKGGGIGLLFGPIGLLAQSAVNSEVGKGAIDKAQDALHIDLTPDAQELTRQALASGRYGQAFAATPDAGGPVLQVNPFTVLTFVDDSDVQPYVILKATEGSWTTRYIASVGTPLPLSGDDSLSANGGARLKTVLAAELTNAVGAMLDDIAKPRARDESNLVYVETALPYVRWRMGVVGYKLSDDGATLVYAPKFADATVFSGIHILDKATAKYRAATPDDKTKMLDEGK